jgi:hypothetical protein
MEQVRHGWGNCPTGNKVKRGRKMTILLTKLMVSSLSVNNLLLSIGFDLFSEIFR